ncbi:hypothetical protein VC83_00204 [Pseudogymnoascus destructans]|uniref:cellulase n=2 Tax=Pseudogymnoascus destructans TaxID=655981 RepID=L8GBG8_PSED2|nr:uncharacterized protein VC83_00204 [Pseudogymnoascus destructans]ELR10555.1 hypothetical protein GMDG_04829 [Pseudogymnoascus destructans 20631-21]OAF62922.1 hypothetical protein VC83_00204 [Pseudogymnoascus destructans]
MYLDSDGSGTSEACVSATIGQERIQAATEWLEANGKKGIIGEFAGGANDQCKSAVTGMLEEMLGLWVGIKGLESFVARMLTSFT